MDDPGPHLQQLTKPAQLDKKRFDLEWILPLEPGLTTHVTLYDAERHPHLLAVGHGADEPDTLLDLWTSLSDQSEPAEAIAYVASAYARRTGKIQERL